MSAADHREGAGPADATHPASDADSTGKARPARGVSRRRFLGWLAGGAGASLCGVGAYARWIEPYWVKHHDVEIAIPGLPAEFDGFTIAHLADPHCGRPLSGEDLRGVLDRMRKRGPDIIALVGDLVNRDDHCFGAVFEELARIARQTPTYAVPGNHDYHEGIRTFSKGLRDVGAIEVTNRSCTIERGGRKIVLGGVDDLWRGSPDLDAALAGVARKSQPVIVLAHNPDCFSKIRGREVSLVLAGHTHGGQVKLPMLGPPYVPVRDKQYVRGLFREEGTAMYVSTGVGMFWQVRFNCRPEVPYIVLRCAPASDGDRI